MNPMRLTAAATGLAMVLSTFALAQPAYDAVVVGTLGGSGSTAHGVNELGAVVGASQTLGGSVHAFWFRDGVILDLGTRSGDIESTAYSINDAGVVVGESRDPNGTLHPVYWTDAGDGTWTLHELPTLGGVFGTATRINTSGQITGYTSPAVGGYHAVMWTGGVPADLGTLSYTGTLAYSQGLGLNDAGDTVGYAYRVLGGPEHGFFKAFGARQEDITPPTGQFALAQGHSVNAARFVCGHLGGSSTPAGEFHAAVRDPSTGQWTLIPLLEGHTDSYAFDINNSNDVVGRSFLPSSGPGNGDSRGFLWRAGTAFDLNAITSSLPSQIIEATDITHQGKIAATASDGAVSTALLLVPRSVPRCDPDYNLDGNADQDDVAYLVNVIAGGPNPSGRDPDFTRDGNVDQDDYAALVNVVAGGACP